MLNYYLFYFEELLNWCIFVLETEVVKISYVDIWLSLIFIVLPLLIWSIDMYSAFVALITVGAKLRRVKTNIKVTR